MTVKDMNLMSKQKVTYAQVLEKLALPLDTDKVKGCNFCGNYLHLVKVNSIVGFWVHRGEDVKTCGDQNTVYIGKPMIVQNMNFYRQMASIWMGIRNKNGEKKDEL